MKKVRIISFIFAILFLFSSCGQNKSISTATNDDVKLQLTTEYFNFYCNDGDKRCLNDLANNLNDNYKRITNDLHATIPGRVNIYMYPDLITFHKEINQPNAPNWVVGTACQNNSIKMVSPLNSGGTHSYNEMVQVIVHEFTHIVISSINSNVNVIPIWLNEGTAEFEAKQMTEGYKKTLKNKLLQNYYPTLSDLEKDTYTFGNDGGYQYSYTIVDYIVKNYGYDKLRDLIKSPFDFLGVLGISEGEFQKSWTNYLIQNYK